MVLLVVSSKLKLVKKYLECFIFVRNYVLLTINCIINMIKNKNIQARKNAKITKNTLIKIGITF